jgi:cell shape-determining protein MreD
LEFPFIYTNFWDALIAVPAIIILIEILKIFFPYYTAWIPTIANLLGLIISVFITHPHSLWTGIVMGIVYGISAVGSYAGFVKVIHTYRDKSPNSPYK